MLSVISVSIGLGLAVSLLFWEIFGISIGGMVTVGYIALYLNLPFAVIMTVASSYFTFIIVKGLSKIIIIYGRREVAAMILVGYIVGVGVNFLAILICRNFLSIDSL